MSFTNILIFSAVLTFLLFSSGIVIISAANLELVKLLSKRGGISGLVANWILSGIAIMGKVRRAWIRLITPGIDRGA